MADENGQSSITRTPNLTLWQKWRLLFTQKLILTILLGQLLSLCLCGTGVFSHLLEDKYSIKAPTTQSFLNYLLLAVVFLSQLACKGCFIEVLKSRGWKYFVLGLIDVEANFLVVKAYQYTNLTSIQVLDCFSLPTVLGLSYIFLKVRYKVIHYGSIMVSMVGIACLITADYFSSRNYGPGSNQVAGDVLVLCGSILYGLSNVCQEFLVKNFNITEFLAMLGLSGTIVSGIQLSILEHKQLSEINWTYDIGLYFIGFGACLFLLYTLMPVALQRSSAMAVNLSLLTADFYSLIVGVCLFGYKFSLLYFLAFVLVVIGLVVYNSRPVPSLLPSTREYDQLEEETPAQSVLASEQLNVTTPT